MSKSKSIDVQVGVDNDAAEAADRELQEARKLRIRLMDKLGEGGEKAIAKLIALVDHEDPHVARLAARDVVQWLIGKPTQRVEHDLTTPTQIVVVHPGVGPHEAHALTVQADANGDADVIDIEPLAELPAA